MNTEVRAISRVWTTPLSTGGVHIKRVPFGGALTLFNMRKIPTPNHEGQGIIKNSPGFDRKPRNP